MLSQAAPLHVFRVWRRDEVTILYSMLTIQSKVRSITEAMRSVTLSFLKPINPAYDLRVSTSVDDNGVHMWPHRGASSHLSVVVAEGSTVPFAIFEHDKMISISSFRLKDGHIKLNGRRVLPVLGYTAESIFQRIKIVPALFSKKES